MKFKEAAREDIDDVFLCTDEFAEEIVLDGQKMLAVVERTDIGLRDTTDGRGPVSFDSVILYIKRMYIEFGRYYPEKVCILNGEKWYVFSCDCEDLVTLILYKERS